MENTFEDKAANRLNALITELSQLEDWPHVKLDSVLLLYDVCRCLELSTPTTLDLLGKAAINHLTHKGVITPAATGLFRV